MQDFGTNGGSNVWNAANGGPVSGISTLAEWIWSLPDNAQYADLSTAILATGEAASPTPLPAALPLYASGMGVLGFLGWRRKKRMAKAKI